MFSDLLYSGDLVLCSGLEEDGVVIGRSVEGEFR